MIGFKATLQRYDTHADKTGWTFIIVPAKIASKLKPGTKQSFRIKGKIDEHKLKAVSLLPVGKGDFMMPVNATMRKAIKKIKGATVMLEMEEDKAVLKLSPELLACLEDEPEGKKYFESLPKSHQQYYSKWIESAKTEPTKTKRLAAAMQAFANKLSFSQMMQLLKKDQF